MEQLIIVVHVLSAVAIIGLVLIQHGKGADMGASFGSGASQTIFGGAGSGNALTKSTTLLAMVFFVTSLGLAVLAKHQADSGVQVEDSLLANPGAAGDLPSAGASKAVQAPAAATQSATVEPAAPQQVDESQATTKPVESDKQTTVN
ncbi:MAG: preprotein translocase subunit SecG [Gammaproteobacteria bacterium]